MMNTPVDLSTCQPGQKLRSKHGIILTFVGPNPYNHSKDWYPYFVEYPSGGHGSRTRDGFAFKNEAARLPTDHDIVEILPLDKS